MIISVYSYLNPNTAVITCILKETMMGYVEDLTYKYYLGFDTTSCTASCYKIYYTFNETNYVIICDIDIEINSYEDALNYISNIKKEKDASYFKVYNDEYDDITDMVVKYAGPLRDFYKNSSFNSRVEDITNGDLYFLDYNFKISKYTQNSCINLSKIQKRLSM